MATYHEKLFFKVTVEPQETEHSSGKEIMFTLRERSLSRGS